jgi:hypothetical protein
MLRNIFLAIFIGGLNPVHAQIGIKAGINFANVTNASSIKSSNKSGFHAGAFLGTSAKNIIGFRTELIFSRQGYNYKNGSNSGDVTFDYVLLPQLFCINFTKLIQVQIGGQAAFLMRASNDSSNGQHGILDFVNRFDTGITGGAEVHPFKHLLIGARLNYSFGKVFKDLSLGGPYPAFIATEAKNNVFQVFAGLKL